MSILLLPELYYTAGLVFGIFEGLHRGVVYPFLAGSTRKVRFTLGTCMTLAHK